MQDLANSLEAALKYRVEEGNFGAQIYTGQCDYQKETPSLIIVAGSGNENPQGSGNFTVQVECEFRYPADLEDLPAHRELCRNVLGQLMTDDLASQVSSEATNLHLFGISNRQIRSSNDENQWLSTLTFDVYCCLTDLA